MSYGYGGYGFVDRDANIKSELEKVETKGDVFEMDQVMFLIGQFKNFWEPHRMKYFLENCPRMAILLPEMTAAKHKPLALLVCSGWIDREDSVGYIADQIRKMEGY